MSDDILNRIDEVIAGHRQRFDPLGGDVWDEDRVDRWGDGMRVRPARAGIEEASEPAWSAAAAAALPEVPSSELASSGPYRCRGCRVWMPLDVKLCGVCSELPPCAVRRSAAEWGGEVVCFRPAGHDGQHESVEGRCWMDAPPPVEALRPEFPGVLIDPTLVLSNPSGNFEQDAAAFRRAFAASASTGRVMPLPADEPEPVSPLVDAAPDPDPAPSRNPLSDLYAALRARARRGETGR